MLGCWRVPKMIDQMRGGVESLPVEVRHESRAA
jgi:hypothetical protein